VEPMSHRSEFAVVTVTHVWPGAHPRPSMMCAHQPPVSGQVSLDRREGQS
jgi:hypothetical protein